MAGNPNVGPDPVEADPNHVREKTYVAPNPPEQMNKEKQLLPENEAKAKVREDLPRAVKEIKART